MRIKEKIYIAAIYLLVLFYTPLFLLFTFSSVFGILNSISILHNSLIIILNLIAVYFVIKFIMKRYSGRFTVYIFSLVMWGVPIMYYVFYLAADYIKKLNGGYTMDEVILQGKLVSVEPHNVFESFIVDMNSNFPIITESLFLQFLFGIVLYVTFITVVKK